MKRNLNENAHFDYDDSVKICVSNIRRDDPELDCNELRDIFVENGADVKGEHGQYEGEAATFMIVSNLLEDDVIDILNDFLGNSEYAATAESYIIPDDVETDYVVEPETAEFPAYEDVDLDPEKDALNDDALLEGDNILDDAKEELRSVLAQVEDEIYLSDEGIVLDTDGLTVYSIQSNGDMDTDEEEIINAYDLTDADDIFALCDIIKDALASEYPAYDDIDDEEEYMPRVEKMGHHRRLDEKKKNDCCPGTGKVNEADAIDAVLADIDAKIVNESKLKDDNFKKKVIKAINEKQHSLYSNISYNGKSFDKMTLKELKRIYETVSTSLEELKNRTLNESVVEDKVSETIERKKQLLEYLDNEITYRVTRTECLKALNEDGAEISDEELKNLFGPAQGEEEQSSENSEESSDENKDEKSKESSDENKDENKDENAEEGEVVELARIVITLKDAEAANDLKQACIEADIPEDAFELENVDEESATEDEENSDENSEESSENNSEESSEESTEESSEENANESYEYAKYVKALMEGEFGGDQPADDTTGMEEQPAEDNGSEESTENSDENSDENSEEEEDDKQPKFILTNTDYASKLAQVLNDVYGISKDEFEDMVGGPIVEEGSDEDKDDENKEESSEEGSEENKEDNKEEDEIDPSDLFKNL